jgi:hypothetical protein
LAPDQDSERSNLRKEKTLQPDQTVFEMAEEVLARQAKALADQTEQSVERAREIVADTEAGQQLRELANGEHRHEKTRDWQASMLRDRAEERLIHLDVSDTLSRFAAERPYSWLEGYMSWLDGKEARAGYYSLLEEELASLRG